MKKYIAVIAMTILIGFTIQAFADWIDYLPWRIDSDEVLGVCIYEPDEKGLSGDGVKDYLVGSAIMAVSSWEERLLVYTGGTEYDIDINYILKETHAGKMITDFDFCNVHIAFLEYKHKEAEDKTLGVTWSAGSIKGKDMVMIEVYPIVENKFIVFNDRDTITPNEIEDNAIRKVKLIPPNGIYSIILHEFGHAIGLGHQCQEPYGIKFDSIMAPKLDAWDKALEITDYDLASVYQYYGKEGWDSEEKPFQMKYGGASKLFRGDVRCT